MTAPLAVIAAGGTGGHMFPAQALAETLLARGWRVNLSTDDRGARYAAGFPASVRVTTVRSATFARGGVLARAAVPLRVAGGVVASVAAMRRDRPAAVVGFGGYPSIPALAAAWLLRVPRTIHEQNGVLGRVNRAFARRVHAVACGTWPTTLPDGVAGVFTGNPVRAAVADHAATPYTPPGAGTLSLLVIGGSQGARVLSETVPGALAELPDDLRTRLSVSHQARPEDAERVTQAYRDADIAADVQPFFTDLPARMAAAQLVISRAGASSVADIAVIGRPSILIPYAAATADHQTANTRGLAEAGAAIVIAEARLTSADLAARIAAVLQHPETATGMAAGALAQGRPDAAERLAAIVEEIKSKAG